MEVGRVGDLRISGWQHCAPPAGRRSAVWIVEPKTLLRKERLKTDSASRWSAARGCTVGTTKKNGLTRAGLLMEVARISSGAARGPPTTGLRDWTPSRPDNRSGRQRPLSFTNWLRKRRKAFGDWLEISVSREFGFPRRHRLSLCASTIRASGASFALHSAGSVEVEVRRKLCCRRMARLKRRRHCRRARL